MLTAVVVGLSAGAALGAGTDGAGRPPLPTAAVSAGTARIGQLVRVSGAGWGAPGDVVNAVLCGNAALDGDADCDLSNTAQGAIRTDGRFDAAITLSAPPDPCPCVVRFNRHLGDVVVTVPITIYGFATAPPVAHPVPSRAVRVSGIDVAGGGPWTSWFGAPARRTVTFTVTNTGAVTLDDPPVDIAWGRGADPTGFIAPPSVGALAPGEAKTISVRIPFGSLAVGTYTVTVKVDAIGAIGAAHASTSVIPWGWILLAGAALQLGLLKVRNRVRRRVAPTVQVAGVEPADAGEGESAWQPVAEPAPALAGLRSLALHVGGRSVVVFPPLPCLWVGGIAVADLGGREAGLPERAGAVKRSAETAARSVPFPDGVIRKHRDELQALLISWQAAPATEEELAPVADAPADGRALPPTARPRPRRAARRVRTAGLVVACIAAGSCQGGSSVRAAPPSATGVSACALSMTDARALVGPNAAPGRPGALTGLPNPLQRCQYDGGGRSMQLTAFTGSAIFTRFSTITGAAGHVAPELGPGAYCSDGRGESQASVSCFFLSEGNTYILGLDLPLKEDVPAVIDGVRQAAWHVKAAASASRSS